MFEGKRSTICEGFHPTLPNVRKFELMLHQECLPTISCISSGWVRRLSGGQRKGAQTNQWNKISDLTKTLRTLMH